MAAISFIITEDIFARNEGYASDSTSQAAAVNNDCLNPIFDSNIIDNAISVGNCGGTVTQQDESGQASAPITHQTANPTLEVQRATTTQPPVTNPPPTVRACVECFDILTAAQQSTFERLISDRIPGITTIELLCMLLQNNSGEDQTETLETLDEALNIMEETGQITEPVSLSISSCLGSLYGVVVIQTRFN